MGDIVPFVTEYSYSLIILNQSQHMCKVMMASLRLVKNGDPLQLAVTMEQPISAKIRAVANVANLFFRDRQMDLRKNGFEEECKWNHIFLIKCELVMNF